MQEPGGGSGTTQENENTGQYLTSTQIMKEFHRQNPDFALLARFTFAHGQLRFGDLRQWNANYWANGSEAEINERTQKVDLIVIDNDWKNTPENLQAAVDSIKQYLIALYDDPGSAMSRHAAEFDGDVERFLNGANRALRTLGPFVRPFNLNQAELESLNDGMETTFTLMPVLGGMVLVGELATGQKLSFTVLGQRELSPTEQLIIVGTPVVGFGVVFAVKVGGKWVMGQFLSKADDLGGAFRIMDDFANSELRQAIDRGMRIVRGPSTPTKWLK